MNLRPYVHIVDGDVARRASISHDIYVMGLHAEIYQDVDELIACSPRRGMVLLATEKAADPELAIEAIRSLRESLPVAFFSTNPSPPEIVKCMLAGGEDYLEWPFTADALHTSVLGLHGRSEEREKFESRRAAAHRAVEGLTSRQRQVLEGLMVGEANKDIAKRLRISSRTVEIHRARMMTCLNARSVSDAVLIGLYAGIEA